jgi:ABC-type oligopeptide transport system substrate-binding subunit
MTQFKSTTKPLQWFMTMVLAILISGCGDRDPILGGDVVVFDTTPPTITGTTHTNGTTGVPINTAVVVTFSESMDPQTITNTNFTLNETLSGNAVAGSVSYSGVSAVFTPLDPLTHDTKYTVSVKGTPSGVKDLAGNLMASDFVISWTTGAAPDTTAPTVTGTIHRNGQTNVAINTSVGVTFSEGMDPLTITNANFTLNETVSGNAVAGVVSYSGVSAVFSPLDPLIYDTQYTVTVKGLPSGVKDLAGNLMASDFVISWTTGAAPDTTAPTVTGTINTNGATDVPINTSVGVTFSEGMDPLTITNANFTLNETVTGNAVAGVVSYSGVSAVFTPLDPLIYDTQYTVTVKGTPSGVKDLASNLMASDFVISWTTGAAPDTTAPTVTGTIHRNGQTNVAINTSVGVTFSEGMDPLTITNANFTLNETLSGDAVAGVVSYSGVSALFIPLDPLAYDTQYTVTVKGAPSGVKDLAGNLMASDFVISWTTGAAPDTTAPTVTGTINTNGATDVPINTSVGVTFSEGMDPLTITNANFTLNETISGNAVAGVVSYSGVNAVFIPASDLTPSTQYTVTVKGTPSGVKDLASNLMASDFVISWTTSAAPDTTAPTVTGTINTNGATDVPINTRVGVTFSEGMDPLTITNANFTLKETVSGNAVAGVVSYSGVNAVFIPASDLTPNTQYTVTVKGTPSGVKDLASNLMASDFVISWTTSAAPDTTAPTVTGTINTNGATDVPINTRVGVTFSEGMDPLTITNANFTLKETVSGNAVAGVVSYSGVNAVFIPASDLTPSTQYTVTVKGTPSGVKDLASNLMASDFVISWTTSAAPDTTAPTVTGTIHRNGQTNVAINTSVGATFSEGMDPLTINNVNFTLNETLSGDAVAGVVSYSGVSAVFSPLDPLIYNTQYTVTVKGMPSGVKDLAGNLMASDFVISWTTGAAPDTTAPTVTGTINTNGATEVPINTSVGATFSEGMDPLTITNVNFTLNETVSGNAVAGVVSYSGVSAVFIPLDPLAYNTQYTVTVKGAPSGVKDLASNLMASDFVISWTTGAAPDTTAPTVTGTIHRNGQTNVAINTSVGATFSEGMAPLTINNVNFTLNETVSGNAIAGVVSYSGVSAVFSPLDPLTNDTQYTVTVKGAPSGVKDLAGNLMASDFVISWTTGAAPDTTPPTVTGTINTNGATDVPINTRVGVTFSEGMDPLTITNANFTLDETISGNAVAGVVSYSGVNAVFIPASDLTPSTQYTVTVKGTPSGVKDLASNLMASDFVISWTTGAAPDTTAPTVTLVNPADSAFDVAINSAVNATFSEAMDPLTISTATFTLEDSMGDGVTGTVNYNATSKIATFTPSSDLANSSTYTATITIGAQDLAGNALAVDEIWSFSTSATEVIPPPVDLGAAETFGTFGGSAGMTNQGTLTVINGNIGTIATTTSSITGFHDTEGDIFTETGSNQGNVNGTIYTCTNSITGPNSTGVNAAYCALATQARLDAVDAYNTLSSMPSDGVLAGNLAGTTINPGVYTNASAVLIQGGDLTLDALGDPNASFVFQIGTTLTVGGPGAVFPQSVILAGGAQAKNVYWQVGSFATINAGGGGTMFGTIIAQSGVSFSTAGEVSLVTLNGRALSLGASVTMVNTVINVPMP